MGSLPRRTVVNSLLTLVAASGLVAPVLIAQQFPASWFSGSTELAPVVRPVAFQQQPPAAADEAGADVNKNAVDGTGPSVPELDLSMEEFFDQRIGSQLENRWQFSANYTGTQAGQIRAMPGGGVIQPQSSNSSQSDRSSSTGQNIRYFFGNLAANARLGYFRECGSLGSGGVQPSGTLPCF